MMMKSILPVTATAILLAGSASAETVTQTIDLFVTSNFNTATLTQESTFVNEDVAAGTLNLEFDTAATFDNLDGTALVFFGDAITPFPSVFDATLTLGSVTATFSQSDFLFAFGAVDSATRENLSFIDFALFSTGAFLDLDIIDITPEPEAVVFSGDFLRFDGNGVITGINLEVQTLGVAPVPLPASLPLLAVGAVMLGAMRKKSKKKA